MLRTLKKILAATGLLGLLLSAPLAAFSQEEVIEYRYKAAYIYKFLKFIEWPGDKNITSQNSVDICVVGDSPLLNTGSIFKNASSPGLKLSLVEEKDWRNAGSHCHIVFLGRLTEGSTAEVIAGLRGKPVLTVSDTDGFVEQGGIIGFVMNDNKIKLTVNTRSASEAGLRIDAQLLEIALRVVDR